MIENNLNTIEPSKKKLVLPAYAFRKKMMEALSSFLFYKVYKKQKEVSPWKLDTYKNIDGSLGKKLFTTFTINGDDLIQGKEYHDIVHALFDRDTSIESELKVTSFLAGNKSGGMSSYSFVLANLFLFPEHFQSFHENYKKGKKYYPFKNINFGGLLNENTDLVKEGIMKSK